MRRPVQTIGAEPLTAAAAARQAGLLALQSLVKVGLWPTLNREFGRGSGGCLGDRLLFLLAIAGA